MAVPFSRLESEALENYGSKAAYDNLMRYDGIIQGLGENEGIKLVKGGRDNFVERTLYGQNSNVAARGKNQQITTVDDEGFTQIKVPIKIVDGSIVYNQIEYDAIQGDSALAPDLLEDKISQFRPTWVQVISDLLRQATPGANDPYTLLPSGVTGTVNGILIARTVAQQGTDGATTAGITRDNSWWRNQYSNTAYDLTQSSGRRGLHLDVYGPCTRGNNAMFEPNIGICATVVLSSLGAAADNNRRAMYSDASGKMNLGYDNIMFYNAKLIRDSSTRFLNGSAGKIALLNTRALKIKVVQGNGGKVQKEMIDQNNNLGSLPIFWKHKQMSDIDTLNYVTIGYLAFNLVPLSLQDHGLADNCT